jgi:hypothetical protein
MTTRLSQALLALLGSVTLFGSIYFTAVAPPAGIDALGYAVGAWAFAMALGFLAGAVRPGPWVRALLAAHLAFGVVKIVGYHESAAVPFMAVDVLLLYLTRPRPI